MVKPSDVVALFPHLEWLDEDKFLLLAVSGSRAYGINFPDSDWDMIGVVRTPDSDIFGLGRWESDHEQNSELDVRLYSPRRFFGMMTQGSVNNVEMLFLPTAQRDPLLDPLWHNREQFVTKGTINSIIGYTVSTLKRFTDASLADHGSKRRRYIEQYGYDVSAAAHCFRWLWMGKDLIHDCTKLTITMNTSRRTFLQQVKSGQCDPFLLREEITALKEEFESVADDLKDLLRHTRDPFPTADAALINLHKSLIT